MGDMTGSKHTYKSALPCNVAGTQQPRTNQDTHNNLVEIDLPETRTRRLLEVKLMHHYITETGSTMGADPANQRIFGDLVPKFSLTSDALLYSMYTMAALHLEKLGNDEKELDVNVRGMYLSMALREHREELSRLRAATLDSACLTATMLRLCLFATLQERPRQPYTPPSEWLLLSGTTKAVFSEALKIVGDDSNHLTCQFMIMIADIMDSEQRSDPNQRRGLEYILNRDLQDEATESWDCEIQATYHSTLSYIGGILDMTKDDALREDMMSRIVLFPMLVRNRFVELVLEAQPRALVVLAHYFGLLVLYRNVWYIGDSAAEEIRAIASALTGKWLVMLEWPLQQIHN